MRQRHGDFAVVVRAAFLVVAPTHLDMQTATSLGWVGDFDTAVLVVWTARLARYSDGQVRAMVAIRQRRVVLSMDGGASSHI
jgi:hypothetical protein